MDFRNLWVDLRLFVITYPSSSVPPEFFLQSSQELNPNLDKLCVHFRSSVPGHAKSLRRPWLFAHAKFCLLKKEKLLDLQIEVKQVYFKSFTANSKYSPEHQRASNILIMFTLCWRQNWFINTQIERYVFNCLH